MKKSLLLDAAHMLAASMISKDDIVVDATMGNGYDTLFLAQHAKHVYAFDIQEKALKTTQERLDAKDIKHVTLIQDSHEHILSYVKTFKGVIFNLGYLPHADKRITTTKDTTLRTLDMLLPVLRKDGFILLVVYVGHLEGVEESKALDAYLATLDTQCYKILRLDLPYQDHLPPYAIFIQKTKDEC